MPRAGGSTQYSARAAATRALVAAPLSSQNIAAPPSASSSPRRHRMPSRRVVCCSRSRAMRGCLRAIGVRGRDSRRRADRSPPRSLPPPPLLPPPLARLLLPPQLPPPPISKSAGRGKSCRCACGTRVSACVRLARRLVVRLLLRSSCRAVSSGPSSKRSMGTAKRRIAPSSPREAALRIARRWTARKSGTRARPPRRRGIKRGCACTLARSVCSAPLGP